jgi:hypothetical protein
MGEVQEISREELLLSVGSEEELLVPVDALGSLAIQQGTRRRVKEGALIGLGTGATAFGAIHAAEGGCGGGALVGPSAAGPPALTPASADRHAPCHHCVAVMLRSSPRLRVGARRGLHLLNSMGS